MSEIKKQCKSFGILFSIIFAVISIYLYFQNINFYLISFFILLSLFFLILSILKPTTLRILNYIWRRFGIFLGMIISPIILSIIYFFLFTFTKLVLVMLGKDLLNLKKNNTKKTFWVPRSDKLNTMNDQF